MVGTMNSLVNVETRNDFTNYLCHYLLPSFVLFPIRIEKKKRRKEKKKKDFTNIIKIPFSG